MNRLQASMRDRASNNAREKRYFYKVGGPFKACRNCGTTTVDESGRVRYTSGFQVFRAYDPSWLGYTWHCYTCGAMDLACWAPDSAGMVEAELGHPPSRIPTPLRAKAKYELRKKLVALNGPSETAANEKKRLAGERARQIEELEAQLAKLETMAKGARV